MRKSSQSESLAFSIFLLRGFFMSIPQELEEAALVDGANRLRVLVYIVLPLARPGLATVAIFQGMFIWNEFFLAFIYIRNTEMQTIPLSLVNFFYRYNADWTLYFAVPTRILISTNGRSEARREASARLCDIFYGSMNQAKERHG